ncbi:hypothetical protein A0H81_04966 [Grifola frondosa]|uniref:Uncharacterized protein n=1 Tax=Grifola frondosa TaxID=5627 RepID=A0A1C7MGP1_GRIFR|nr:hypothetical protein A0H81_04966 [Grifola frondosa]
MRVHDHLNLGREDDPLGKKHRTASICSPTSGGNIEQKSRHFQSRHAFSEPRVSTENSFSRRLSKPPDFQGVAAQDRTGFRGCSHFNLHEFFKHS